jgi:hypothetical protein
MVSLRMTLNSTTRVLQFGTVRPGKALNFHSCRLKENLPSLYILFIYYFIIMLTSTNVYNPGPGDYGLSFPVYFYEEIPPPLTFWCDECIVVNSHDPMQGDGQPTTDLAATTAFTEDGVTASVVWANESYEDQFDHRFASIREFLERPILVSQFAWPSADPAGTNYVSLSVANLLVGSTQWMNKIQGYNLVRGTACFRVQLNSTPFMQGRLLVHFLPRVEVAGRASMMNAVSAGLYSLISITQHPGVEIGCSDSVVEIEIPYITPFDYYDIKNAVYDWGTVYITSLSPLQVSGSNPQNFADVTVWLHFKDFEVAAPSIPQSRFLTRKISKSDEAEIANTTTVSKTLNAVSKAANALSAIPMISSYTRNLAWASSALAGLASSFGYSKPLFDSPPGHMLISANRYSASSDGLNTALTLGLSATNQVAISTDMSIRDVDEMSWSFLKSVYALYTTITWTPSTVGPSAFGFANFALSPSIIFNQKNFTAGSHTLTANLGPPIYYLSNLFQAYRGGLKMKIKFVKTQFHSGRLMLTFTPGYNVGTAASTNTTSVLSLREIIDIRYCDEIEFILPYICPMSYLDMSQPFGFLNLFVLNQLRGPETVPNNVQLLVYFCGADDLEYELPIGRNDAYTYPIIPNSNMIVSKPIGNSKPGTFSSKFAEASIGEMFRSVKQITNRANVIARTQAWGITPNTGFSYWPWSFTCGLNFTSALVHPISGYDSTSYIALMYAYFKGGATAHWSYDSEYAVESISVQNTTQNFSTVTTVGTALSVVAGRDIINFGYQNNSSASGHVFLSGAVNGGSSASIPYYATTRFSTVIPDYIGNPSIQLQLGDAPVVRLNVSSTSDATGLTLFRSMNDDFQLAYFVGCPPIYVNYS